MQFWLTQTFTENVRKYRILLRIRYLPNTRAFEHRSDALFPRVPRSVRTARTSCRKPGRPPRARRTPEFALTRQAHVLCPMPYRSRALSRARDAPRTHSRASHHRSRARTAAGRRSKPALVSNHDPSAASLTHKVVVRSYRACARHCTAPAPAVSMTMRSTSPTPHSSALSVYVLCSSHDESATSPRELSPVTFAYFALYKTRAPRRRVSSCLVTVTCFSLHSTRAPRRRVSSRQSQAHTQRGPAHSSDRTAPHDSRSRTAEPLNATSVRERQSRSARHSATQRAPPSIIPLEPGSRQVPGPGRCRFSKIYFLPSSGTRHEGLGRVFPRTCLRCPY